MIGWIFSTTKRREEGWFNKVEQGIVWNSNENAWNSYFIAHLPAKFCPQCFNLNPMAYRQKLLLRKYVSTLANYFYMVNYVTTLLFQVMRS